MTRGGQVLDAADPRERLINRDRADRNRRRIDDGLADARDVAAGGQIHDRVGAVLHRVAQFFELFVDVRSDRGVADVGVDLAFRRDADGHRLEVAMIDVGRNDHAAARDLRPDQLRREVLAVRDMPHLFGDDACRA